MNKKEIRKEILRLGIPASLEVVFQLFLGLIDMIFVGYFGTIALAGVSLTNQIVSLLLLVYGTVGVGASILISQYYGKSDTKSMSEIAGQSLLLGVVIGFLTSAILAIFASQLLCIMGAEAKVVAVGVPFFRIIAASMPLSLLSIVAGAILRSVGNTKIPLVITSISVVANTMLNYVLMFGAGIIPALGVNGAAYATLISRIIAVVLIFYYILHVNKSINFQINHFFAIKRNTILKICNLTYPIAGGELIWAVGTFLYAVLFTRLGTDQLVASQIINNIESIFIMFSFGISIAGLTLVAKEIGAENFDLMREKANEILKTGLISSIVFGLLLFAVSNFIHVIYPAIDANANNLAKWGLIIYALFQPVKVSNMIMGNGILKSGGITRFVATVDIVVAFFIGLPVAYILGIHFGIGFYGVIIGRLCEEVFRIILFAIRYRVPNWYRVLAV